nr:MAG TPA: hypothetical protein [Caudoviricetes sp.]DAX15797.1 MAG TPA: hypothetical protein [Caudoviricetes sp.]
MKNLTNKVQYIALTAGLAAWGVIAYTVAFFNYF